MVLVSSQIAYILPPKILKKENTGTEETEVDEAGFNPLKAILPSFFIKSKPKNEKPNAQVAGALPVNVRDSTRRVGVKRRPNTRPNNRGNVEISGNNKIHLLEIYFNALQ